MSKDHKAHVNQASCHCIFGTESNWSMCSLAQGNLWAGHSILAARYCRTLLAAAFVCLFLLLWTVTKCTMHVHNTKCGAGNCALYFFLYWFGTCTPREFLCSWRHGSSQVNAGFEVAEITDCRNRGLGWHTELSTFLQSCSHFTHEDFASLELL